MLGHAVGLPSWGQASIQLEFLPIVGDMALIAAIAELAVMNVFCAMAGNAGGAHRGRHLAFGCRFGMTGLATCLAMRAVQNILRTSSVVVLPNRPSAGVVAFLACSAKFEFVLVLLFVARVAVLRRIFEAHGLMAALAGNDRMTTG